jgi:hypothetical protein
VHADQAAERDADVNRRKHAGRGWSASSGAPDSRRCTNIERDEQQRRGRQPITRSTHWNGTIAQTSSVASRVVQYGTFAPIRSTMRSYSREANARHDERAHQVNAMSAGTRSARARRRRGSPR